MGVSPGTEDVPGPARHLPLSFRLLSAASLLWGFVTVLIGADVTFTGSELACPDWPLCGPVQVGSSAGALIELTHRGAALVLSLLILFLFVSAVVSRTVPVGLRYLSAFAFLLVVAQALVGGAVILSQASPTVVVLHLGLAVLLVATLSALAVLAYLPSLPPRWQRFFLGGAMERTADSARDPGARPGAGPPSESVGSPSRVASSSR